MKRRGVFQLSFGIIFSIFLIAAIIAVAFYAIDYFLGLQKCTEISLFYKGLQDDVKRAWNSEITRETFSGTLPGGIESVCFGNLESNEKRFPDEFNNLRRFRGQTEANMFLYPRENACQQAFFKLEHVTLEELESFECFAVEKNKVNFKLEKESSDALVRIKR